MKMAVFWAVALCSLVEVYNIFEVFAASITDLMMETASTSEMSVIFYHTSW
jgi:hypothetical protein